MISEFEHLNKEEVILLTDAIPLITILIGGADGELDPQELEWAKKVTEIRTYNNPDNLKGFYSLVEESYDAKLNQYLTDLPKGVEERTLAISDKLAKLNAILPKLEEEYRKEIYGSYKSFAHHVAKASGGFLRFLNVSKEEKDLMDLPMINEIA